MQKEKETYKVNQLVFAKVKGFAPWPAKVLKVCDNGKYYVDFYADDNFAYVESDNLWRYEEQQIKFNTAGKMKGKYKEAVSLIEQDSATVDDPKEDNQMKVDNAKAVEQKPANKNKRRYQVKEASKSVKPKNKVELPNMTRATYDSLQTQLKMIRVAEAIRKTLPEKKPHDLNATLKLMKQYKKEILNDITEFMLLKYPIVVETFGTLERSYKSNNMKDIDETTQQIGHLAIEIFAHMKSLSNIKEDNTEIFIKKFSVKAAKLKKKANNVSAADYFEALTVQQLEVFITKGQ